MNTLVDQAKEAFPVDAICQAIKHPRSTYYAVKKAQQRVDPARLALVEQTRQLHERSGQCYGTRRVSASLTASGTPVAAAKHEA